MISDRGVAWGGDEGQELWYVFVEVSVCGLVVIEYSEEWDARVLE